MLRLLHWFNQHDHWFRLALFVASLLPAALLIRDQQTLNLGFNPFETLVARTGFWAEFYLLLTLAVTPFRRWLGFFCKRLQLTYGKRLADWNFLIRSRRMLGLFSFFYLCWHLAVYLHLEVSWVFSWLWQDLWEKPYLQAGLAGWTLSVLLALTSPQWVRRRLGKRWRQLHRAMYPLCLLAVLHIMLRDKIGEYQGLVYASLTALLLLHRVLAHYIKRWHRAEDDGLEAKR